MAQGHQGTTAGETRVTEADTLHANWIAAWLMMSSLLGHAMLHQAPVHVLSATALPRHTSGNPTHAVLAVGPARCESSCRSARPPPTPPNSQPPGMHQAIMRCRSRPSAGHSAVATHQQHCPCATRARGHASALCWRISKPLKFEGFVQYESSSRWSLIVRLPNSCCRGTA